MNTPHIRAVHAIPAFIVGGTVWCVLAMLLSHVDEGVLGFFSAPGLSTWLILFSAAAVYFPVFFLLRALKRLSRASFAGGLALVTLALLLLDASASPRLIALLSAMAAVSGAVAFAVMRSGARADARTLEADAARTEGPSA